MAAEPNKNQPGNPDAERRKMKRMLMIAGGIGVIVILVTVMAGLSGSGGRKMSDGSDGSIDDPDMKEVSPGVKVRDIKEGKGEPCPRGAKVKIHYTGWLRDGTEFDTSKNSGPIEYALSALIGGWQHGIPGMKPGGIRKLVIAPNEGYGSKQKGKIPPGSTLIFEVELLDFTPPRDLTRLFDGTTPEADDPGLKDLGDGLKIRDLKEGSGMPVQPGASVLVHYTGWTVDGKMFESSRKTDEPISASLDPGSLQGVIEGWQKGIVGMKPGGIRKLVIPPALAYRDRKQGNIPPNSTLIFEVELLR